MTTLAHRGQPPGELGLLLADRLFDALAAVLGGGGRVADVGGGRGSVAIELATRGVPTVLVDRFDTRLPGSAVPFVLADAGALPFASGGLGGVHMARTLGHLPDWRAALAEVARVLAPGGVFGLDLGGWLADGPVRELQRVVADAAARRQVCAAPMLAQPAPAEIDAELARFGITLAEPVTVTGTFVASAYEVVSELVGRTDRWASGHDVRELAAAGDAVLAGLPDRDGLLRQPQCVSYRVYHRA